MTQALCVEKLIETLIETNSIDATIDENVNNFISSMLMFFAEECTCRV